MELRTARKGEESQVSDLAVKVFKPNMKEQFIRLYSVQNLDHMFVALDQGKMVSSVNYYVSHIESSHGIFKVASIGSVCTDSDYRGQGLASKLLEMAEEKMKQERIDFCIISGRRGMYKRFGAKDVGAINRYVYEPLETNDNLEYRKVAHNADELFEIYKNEEIKYRRDLDEFNDLWKGQTYPDSYQTYHTYLISKDHQALAYIIIIDHRDKSMLTVKEYAGKRDIIYPALSKIAKLHHKNQIEIMIPHQDKLNEFMIHKYERITQQATLKMIDKTSCLNKLNRYLMNQEVTLGYSEESELYHMTIKEKKYTLNHDKFHELVFSGIVPKFIHENHQELMQSIFPVELPWSHNLNYQ